MSPPLPRLLRNQAGNCRVALVLDRKRREAAATFPIWNHARRAFGCRSLFVLGDKAHHCVYYVSVIHNWHSTGTPPGHVPAAVTWSVMGSSEKRKDVTEANGVTGKPNAKKSRSVHSRRLEHGREGSVAAGQGVGSLLVWRCEGGGMVDRASSQVSCRRTLTSSSSPRCSVSRWSRNEE